MATRWVKNFDNLATTENRKNILSILESGLNAINTRSVMKNKIKLEDDLLKIEGHVYDLSIFKKIKIVGFGKSSCSAAMALEEILGDRITTGAVVSIDKVETQYIETFKGSHPRPTQDNVVPGQRIYEILKDSTEEDLVIVLVSGGGSALLCYPETEYSEGARLYDEFLHSGKTINEINTVRKHLSMLKGGGLAKVAYPATVIGLIFSDVPGDNFQNVASGSTYKDDTTVTDAERIIKENNLGEYDLIETPKEDKYFEKVKNFVLVSNKIAVEAMEKKARDLGFETNIVSTDLYDDVNDSLGKIFTKTDLNVVSLAAGEPKVKVGHGGGKGGRNLHMGLLAIQDNLIKDENSVFISFASDGMDNTDMAGAIVDMETIKKAENLGLNVKEYAENFDSYNFFAKTGDLINTGPTDTNVSDLMILLNR